jgi:hypothetical protein
MTDKDNCAIPTRECPFDTDTIKSLGNMEATLKIVQAAVTNGNGLTQRMAKAEEFIAELKGGGRAMRATVLGVGFVLAVLQIISIVMRVKATP